MNHRVEFSKNYNILQGYVNRIEMPDYPERAVLEGLVNALIHRNYLELGSEVHLDMFDDRLEIYSPGGMCDGSRVQDRDRLVLNGESHMEERTKGLESMDYLDLLDDEQRRRTAQEVICFLYLLNEQHVLAHLDGMKDVKKTIKQWCNQIKVFYNDDAVQ